VKELALTIRVHNNILRKLRLEIGLSTPGQAAKQYGIGYSTYVRLENCFDSPRKADGNWRDVARKIAEYHGLSCEDVFPPAIEAVKKPKVCMEISGKDLARTLIALREAPALPGSDLEARQDAAQIRQLMERSLTTREQVVVSLRMGLANKADGPMTHEEIAKYQGITKTRIRQIEMRALRKMKHAIHVHARHLEP